MIEAEIAQEIIGMVPHWYRAKCGPQRYSLTVGDHREFFFNHRKLTPILEKVPRPHPGSDAGHSASLLQYFSQPS